MSARYTKYNIQYTGFTLVELLVVIAILGVLVTIGLTSFMSAQARGRDTQRKSDLKQLSNALELYYSDYGRYPVANNGKIMGCLGASCEWGSGQFTDGKTVYFRIMPKDPTSSAYYFYRVPDALGQKFQIFTHLENTQDPALITTSYSCGSGTNLCNFALTSPNTTPSEE